MSSLIVVLADIFLFLLKTFLDPSGKKEREWQEKEKERADVAKSISEKRLLFIADRLNELQRKINSPKG